MRRSARSLSAAARTVVHAGRCAISPNGDDDGRIDVVYLWVDGSDPSHRAKRERYMREHVDSTDAEKAVGAYRWEEHREIVLSLRSIERFCPWISRIWIVTDNQSPPLDSLSGETREKIRIVDHREIFAGFERYLPCFNSRAIETLLWRIDGLSERFVYFNDDMIVTRPLTPSAFFAGWKPVLRGRFAGVGESESMSMHKEGMLNAARLSGWPPDGMFYTAHAPYVLTRTALAELLRIYPDEFERNISFRFRHRSQFKIVSLYSLFMLQRRRCVVRLRKDYVHLSQRACNELDRTALIRRLRAAKRRSCRFLCLNDLGSLEHRLPDFQRWLPDGIAVTECGAE